MSGLREFLLERILEDESAAQRAIDSYPPAHRWSESGAAVPHPHYAHDDPWRVLSGCVAKRLMIAAHRDVGPTLEVASSDRPAGSYACSTCGPYDEQGGRGPCYTLRVLALHWVDHPGYRNEWRPERLRCVAGRA
jgi:hypothetical protein